MAEIYQYYNNLRQNVNVDNALASVLANFDSDWVYITVQQALEYKFRPYQQHMPNIIYGIEQQMKLLSESFERKDEIEHVRIATYREIIDQVAAYFNLQFNDVDQDYYATAYYMYQYLVSDFTDTVFTFFVNYILTEKDNLYTMVSNMAAEDAHKRDSAYTYSKSIYADNAIAMIHAYIDTIINNMASFDIPFEQFIRMVTMNENMVTLLCTRFFDKGDFYRNYIVPLITDPSTYPYVISSIKLLLQQRTLDYMNVNHQYQTKEG